LGPGAKIASVFERGRKPQRTLLPANLETDQLVKNSTPKNEQELLALLKELRLQLEREFRPDTAAPGFESGGPAAGQCAAVATIVNDLFGGELVSAIVQGQSHWFNQIRVGEARVEIDLTGDQFGRPPLQMAKLWSLYPDTKTRDFSELKAETLSRAAVLAARAQLTTVENSLRRSLQQKVKGGEPIPRDE
jgi:hypothetical protein